MSKPVTDSLVSPASFISFQGHMVVIINLWGVEIPCHYFFDSKMCLPPAKRKKRSQYGIYFQNGSKSKLISRWNQEFRLSLEMVTSWHWETSHKNSKLCERKLLGFITYFFPVNCSFMLTNLFVYSLYILYYILYIYKWLCQVLVAACRIFFT